MLEVSFWLPCWRTHSELCVEKGSEALFWTQCLNSRFFTQQFLLWQWKGEDGSSPTVCSTHSVDCRPRSGPRCLCGTWGIASVRKVPLCFHSHPEDALEMIPTSLCIKGMRPSFHELISVVKRKCRVEPGWLPSLKSGVLVPQGDSLTHLGSEDCRVAGLPEMHEALQGSARINLAPWLWSTL